MRVRIGDLRHRFTLERAEDLMDDAGGFDRVFVPEGSIYASIQPRSRKEALKDGRMAGVVTHSIVLRWRDDIDGDVRFVDGLRGYRVLATEAHDVQRRFLRCLCEEEQA